MHPELHWHGPGSFYLAMDEPSRTTMGQGKIGDM